MKKTVYVIGLLLLLVSCHSGKDSFAQKKIIDASLENIDEQNSVFKDFSVVCLETTDSCLLENIVKVEYQEDIYLLSSYGGTVYKFTKDGRYLWHLKQGNGPGELIFATDFFVDHSTRSVYVLDNYRDLKIYSFEGEYIKTEHLPALAFLFTKRDDTFLCFDPNLSRKSDFNFYVYRHGEKVDENLKKSDDSRNVGYMPGSVFAFAGDDSVYIQHMLSDSIYSYSLSDNSLTPLYFIYTNGLSVNSRDIHFPDSRSFYQICKEQGLIPGVSGLSYFRHKIYLTMFYDNRPLYVVYDVDMQRSTVFTSLCEGFPGSTRCVGRSKEGIIYCYDVEELAEYAGQGSAMNERLMPLMKSVKPEDNPILVVFR